MANEADVGYERLELLIDGQWRSGRGGKKEILNPATGERLGDLSLASPDDLDLALEAAQGGLASWRRALPAERARVLRLVAEFMRQDADRLARIMTLEQGKPLAESKAEILASAERYEWLGEESKRVYGKILPPSASGAVQEVTYEPVGVVLGLSPWNFPASVPANKIGHALAAGCSIIIKPDEETPGTSIAIARLFQKAGLPNGVLNLVFGVPAEVSSYLISSPIIRKVSFTGSVPVGKHLYRLCADGMKKITMELGGHSPVVIFDDVDVDQVAAIGVAGKYRNAGQICIAPTRFLVHEAVADRFIARFAEKASAITLGSGLDPDVQMGPLAHARRVEMMERFVGDARDRGGRVVTGGERIGNRGFFFAPTVISDLPREAEAMTSEVFGPIACINRWSHFDDVVEEANCLPYGLAAYAFTKSQKRARDIAGSLQAGMVGVNSLAIAGTAVPFGGVKDSGIGREGGIEGLLEYMTSKTVSRLSVE